MYFGSVKFFKHLILTVTALLIIIPTTISIVLGIQLSGEKQENQRLKEEVNSLRLGDGENYSPDEMFELYNTSLEDKETYLRLIHDQDAAFYEAAAGLSETRETVSSDNTITAVPVTPGEQDSDDVTVDTEVRPAYEKLYPELYAEGVSDIVYNMDMDYVYLTFDDGPSKYTDNILFYLDAYDIKATFFVVPDGSESSNASLKKIAEAGHTIGIHTATHDYNKIYESVESYLEDFKIAYDRVYSATGIKCNLFRFPGGSINDYNTEIREDLIAEMTRRGFIYFDWNVDSSDALGASWTEMYNTVLSGTANANRAVILMHDYNGGWNTILVLEDIIKALISDPRGYKLDKLTENVKPVQF